MTSHPSDITVTLTREQAETAIYGLRGAARRQEQEQEQEQRRAGEPLPFMTGKVPVNEVPVNEVSSIPVPEYDPWPSDMADLADKLERLLGQAAASI